jgi:hypothetical protein
MSQDKPAWITTRSHGFMRRPKNLSEKDFPRENLFLKGSTGISREWKRENQIK